ncbi:MAG: DNA translocase FtsK 4TM domain-containing protein, partial [Candidatus Marinimicrobia bacterium]|nr:DNA translocase FtsK 4TM domain-containing protein [Candidatus Neomarinimicrobiota bacterium]
MAKTQSEENGVAPAGAAGVLLAVLGLLVLLSLISYDPADVSFLQVPARAAPANFIGPAGAYLAFVLLLTLGVTAYLTPVILLAQSAFLLFYRRGARWPKFCWLLLGLVSCLLLAQLHGAAWAGVSARLNLPAPGGLAGYWLGTRALIAWLGPMGAGLLAGGGLLAALLLLTELEPSAVAGAVAGAWRWTSDRATEWLAARREQNSVRDTQNELRERSNRRLKQWSEAQAEAKPSGPRVRPAVLPPDRTP